MVGYRNTSDVTKKAAEVHRRWAGKPMVSFISIMEVKQQLGCGIASTPKTQNPEQHF